MQPASASDIEGGFTGHDVELCDSEHPSEAEDSSPVCLADEAVALYESLGDTDVPVFANAPRITPSISELSELARMLLHFCCSRSFSAQEITHQYNFVRQLSDGCSCSGNFVTQIPSARSFELYADNARMNFFNAEGWRRAVIETAAEPNRTGFFRSIVQIVRDEVARADGLSSVVPHTPRTLDDQLARSSPVYSDSLLSYYLTRTTQNYSIAVDIYADLTALARSGSHSACLLRCRIVNMQGRSEAWNDF
eukprot:IDg2692t1